MRLALCKHFPPEMEALLAPDGSCKFRLGFRVQGLGTEYAVFIGVLGCFLVFFGCMMQTYFGFVSGCHCLLLVVPGLRS